MYAGACAFVVRRRGGETRSTFTRLMPARYAVRVGWIPHCSYFRARVQGLSARQKEVWFAFVLFGVRKNKLNMMIMIECMIMKQKR